MSSLRSPIGVACGLLVVSPGCARHDARATRAALTGPGSADTAALEGVWEGEVWETPSFYVFLDGDPVGPELCVPRSLEVEDRRMWAAFETSFKGRTAPAMIGLERARERVPETTRASDKP